MEQDLVLPLLLAIMKELPTIMETLSIRMMDAIIVLAYMDKSIALKTLANQLPAITKVKLTMKETLSIRMMDAIIHVLALLDKSIALKTLANQLPAITKVKLTMKETHSLPAMDVILVLALLETSLVRKTHVDAIMKVIHTVKETLSLV